MIRALLLAGLAWLACGATGAPCDPFLPLGAALALHPRWPRTVRFVGTLALGPLCAIACGDALPHRALTYVTLAALAAWANDILRDGWIARVTLATSCVVVTLTSRWLLAYASAAPHPAEGWIHLAYAFGWTALHARLTLPVLRASEGP